MSNVSGVSGIRINTQTVLVLFNFVIRILVVSAIPSSEVSSSRNTVTWFSMLLSEHCGNNGSSTLLVSGPGPPQRWASQGRRGALYRGPAAKFRRQQRAAKTLGIVVGGFLLCWFPFFIILPIDAACESCNLSESTIFAFAFWLGYFNSCINPLIYACSSRELRRAFQSILRRAFFYGPRSPGSPIASNDNYQRNLERQSRRDETELSFKA